MSEPAALGSTRCPNEDNLTIDETEREEALSKELVWFTFALLPLSTRSFWVEKPGIAQAMAPARAFFLPFFLGYFQWSAVRCLGEKDRKSPHL